MGIVRWLQQRSFVEGEPPVDRVRKSLVAPMYVLCGAACCIIELLSLKRLFELGDKTATQQTAQVLRHGCTGVVALALLPAGLYIVLTRRISRELCEYPVIACTLAAIAYDFGMALETLFGAAFVLVVLLDCLLVCSCRPSVTKGVVVVSVIWMLARSVMDVSDVSGHCGPLCSDSPLFSVGWFQRIIVAFFLKAVVFVADFHFTRGFATSMTEQRALVEASVRVSEAAAVLLSRYETEAARELLEGADGGQLPPLLLSALRQLVGNLAVYRPYLPQSCLPGGEGTSAEPVADDCRSSSSGGGCEDSGRREPERKESQGVRSFASGSGSFTSSLSSSQQRGQRSTLQRVVGFKDAVQRKVSLATVNSVQFLRSCGEREWAAAYVRSEVSEFTRVIAEERGVVDLISGDHLFANFNASRICTTHRVSAARAAWGLTAAGGADPPNRTAAVCSGWALCGDFGTPDMRRFMLLGAVFNTQQALERVAARAGRPLIDETVGADADVGSNFFTALVERVCFAKRGTKPFRVWQLAGRRVVEDSPDEWMYELERQAPNPYEEWNGRMREWLEFGAPMTDADLDGMLTPFSSAAVTLPREQTQLAEAAVVGGTVALPDPADTVGSVSREE